jgi:hypothetical protein
MRIITGVVVIKKLIHIWKGWGKRFGIISTSTAEEKLSELRLEICKRCDHAKTSSFLELVNGGEERKMGLFCTECKCACLEKSLVVDEQCPIDKW